MLHLFSRRKNNAIFYFFIFCHLILPINFNLFLLTNFDNLHNYFGCICFGCMNCAKWIVPIGAATMLVTTMMREGLARILRHQSTFSR